MKVQHDPFKIAFGKRIKQLLDEKGMTPTDVAAQGNIEVKQVYRVINAEHNATLPLIASLAKGIGVHPKELFDFNY